MIYDITFERSGIEQTERLHDCSGILDAIEAFYANEGWQQILKIKVIKLN